MWGKNIFVLVNVIQWGIYLNLINVEFRSNNLPLMSTISGSVKHNSCMLPNENKNIGPATISH